VLLLVMHHIASDGWSVSLLMHALGAFYTAFVTGAAVVLPALPIQYADYAVWQRQWLQGETLDTQVTYWTQQLRGALPVLDLPKDYPRPMVQTYHGTRQVLDVPPGVTEGLKTLSRHAGVTLFMTLLAAWQTLLSRYTGQDDISVGTPIAGRTRTEIEGLIGFFVNTLVLRTDLSGDPTFIDLLPRVREIATGAYAHQDLPFEKLVEEIHPERNLSYSSLFQVMFAFQNVPSQALSFPALEVSALDVDQGTSKFDLSLSLWEEAGGLTGSLEYNTDLFAPPTITRMAGHLQTLLAGIAADPTQRLSQLPLLPEAERRQLLVEWNTTQTAYPHETCVHELVAAQAARTPDYVAIVYEGDCLTYRELNVRANQLAHYLRRHGVGPDVPVGLCMERSLDMLVGVLGILKAGAAYVPLDPAYPQARVAFMLEDSGAPVLLTHRPVLPALPEHQARVVRVDTDWEAVAQECEENPSSGVTPAHLAYVIYTSGSTGKPKGVQIPHRAVVNFLHTMAQRPGIVAQDILLAVTTLSFDIAGLEIFLPLTVGARVVVVRRSVAADGQQLAQRLADTGATMMQATPATWRLLLASGWRGHDRLKILCGGDALPGDLAEALREDTICSKGCNIIKGAFRPTC
jgi:non-ribosomal peptide synthetase component F